MSPRVAISAVFALNGLLFAALFSRLADRSETAGPAVAAVSGMGYLGFLAGLTTALVLVVALCAAAALLAPAVRKPDPR